MNALRNLEESMGYARQVELDLLCKMMDSYFICKRQTTRLG